MLTVDTNRGKSQSLDRNKAGVGSLVVDNSDRLFDPLYAAGTYYGELVPRKQLRVSANSRFIMNAFIDDFDIIYQPGERSRVSIDYSDGFSILANLELDAVTPASELSGARINRVLDLPEVNWAEELRDIDAGDNTLLGNPIEQDTNSLSYLQLVESSESGNLFIDKSGRVTFFDKGAVADSGNIVFTDSDTIGTGTPVFFSDLNVVYGSENLYNKIVLENAAGTALTATAEDAQSQLDYGVRTYNESGLLVQNLTDLQDLADSLLVRFSQPEYRFESVQVVLNNQTTEKQNELLDLEIGDIVKVKFTPSNIPPAIIQTCRIIGIRSNWATTLQTMEFALERVDTGLFILDDGMLGLLDQDTLS
jgi:hypothetical protein